MLRAYPALAYFSWFSACCIGFRAIYFSKSYMQYLPNFVQILDGTQTFFGFVGMFFLGLELGKRFRLK